MPVRLLAALHGLVLLGGLLVAGPVGLADPPTPAAESLTTAPSPGLLPSPSAASPAASPEAEPAAAAPAPPPPPSPSPPPTPPPAPRVTARTGFAPYAVVGPVVLHAPGDVVEAIGFHQSGHDGAQQQAPVEGTKVRLGLLEQRGRDTNPAGASDIVMDPAREVRSPVTGTIVRAGRYTLYCEHVDEYFVVEPDERPGFEVKVLHIVGLTVTKGDRVEAGKTVVAAGPRRLPFDSQIDEFTGKPTWPHVHIEVVDTAIQDRRSGGGC